MFGKAVHEGEKSAKDQDCENPAHFSLGVFAVGHNEKSGKAEGQLKVKACATHLRPQHGQAHWIENEDHADPCHKQKNWNAGLAEDLKLFLTTSQP